MFCYGWNFIKTLVGLPKFTYPGVLYFYPAGWQYNSSGSDGTWNYDSSSDPNILLISNNR